MPEITNIQGNIDKLIVHGDVGVPIVCYKLVFTKDDRVELWHIKDDRKVGELSRIDFDSEMSPIFKQNPIGFNRE